MKSAFRMDLLQGKVAIITGGATGICFGIAKQFLVHGAFVLIASRKLKNIQAAVSSLKQISPNVAGKTCDVRNFEQCVEVAKEAISKWGSIDILVNGAAGNFLAPLDKLTTKGFKTVLQIDTVGTFNMSKAVAQSGKFKGSIINISATLHYQGVALQSHAGAAKAAVDALTKHFAVELGPRGIRVNGVAPGPIQGTQGMTKLNPDKDGTKKIAEMLPVQHLGQPWDIAQACLFLTSESARFVTGFTIVVDGGQVLTAGNFTFLHEGIRKSLQEPLATL